MGVAVAPHKEGTVFAVSCSSFKVDTKLGASASILTNQSITDALQTTSIVSGNKEIQNANRSELISILASLQMIHNTCAKYNINTQDSACTIVYNGRGSLNKILSLSIATIKTAQSIHE